MAALGAELQTIQAQISAVKDSAQQGAVLREGMTIALMGQPNVGKSSLLNCLSGRETAIVTDIAGTTRDLLREIGTSCGKLRHQPINRRGHQLQTALHDLQLTLPNLPHESVPAGKNEDDNQEVRRWGTIAERSFTPQDHVALGERLGLLDFEAASQLSGSRFVVIKGPLARLHRALGQFMLDVHTEQHGYEEVNVPVLVDMHCLYGTGQMPKFAADC